MGGIVFGKGGLGALRIKNVGATWPVIVLTFVELLHKFEKFIDLFLRHFSEQAIVYDSDSQEQMVPPPYEAQASLTQKEAGPSTSQAGEGAQDDVIKTAVKIESAAEGSNVATETGSDTTPVVVEGKC